MTANIIQTFGSLTQVRKGDVLSCCPCDFSIPMVHLCLFIGFVRGFQPHYLCHLWMVTSYAEVGRTYTFRTAPTCYKRTFCRGLWILLYFRVRGHRWILRQNVQHVICSRLQYVRMLHQCACVRACFVPAVFQQNSKGPLHNCAIVRRRPFHGTAPTCVPWLRSWRVPLTGLVCLESF